MNDATAALVEENRSTIAPATAPPSAAEIAMSLATVLQQLVDTKNNNRAPDETSHGIPIQIEVAMKQGIESGVARALELITIPARHTRVLVAEGEEVEEDHRHSYRSIPLKVEVNVCPRPCRGRIDDQEVLGIIAEEEMVCCEPNKKLFRTPTQTMY